MVQVARNLTDAFEGFLLGKRYLIHDRDPLFTKRFRETLEAADVESLRLPPKSPNLNAYAERWVLSVKSECLARVIPLSERHLRRLLEEYCAHYHLERNHQGLDGEIIDDSGLDRDAAGPIRCQERLGGLLSYYFRESTLTVG